MPNKAIQKGIIGKNDVIGGTEVKRRRPPEVKKNILMVKKKVLATSGNVCQDPSGQRRPLTRVQSPSGVWIRAVSGVPRGQSPRGPRGPWVQVMDVFTRNSNRCSCVE